MIGNHVEGSERLRRRLLARKNLLTEIDHALAAPRIGQCRNRRIIQLRNHVPWSRLERPEREPSRRMEVLFVTVGISDGPSSDPLLFECGLRAGAGIDVALVRFPHARAGSIKAYAVSVIDGVYRRCWD
jgi:hypothetical protein